ncbi:MAG: ABC transporter substrate-binding protein [Bdellovibrionales bacterium]
MTLIRHFLVVVMVLGALIPSSARADFSAQAVIRGFYAELSETMKQGPQLGFGGRYIKLSPVVQASFNMPLMTRMAVGAGWSKASPKEQSDLIAAFSGFSISTYANRFASYDGEEFIVIGEKPSGKGIIVETLLKPKTGEAVTLNYLMRPDEKGRYRIVDVFMDGTISELATRRSEFSSIVRREGVAALIKALEQKAKNLGAS